MLVVLPDQHSRLTAFSPVQTIDFLLPVRHKHNNAVSPFCWIYVRGYLAATRSSPSATLP
jgi:hypothetical protein